MASLSPSLALYGVLTWEDDRHAGYSYSGPCAAWAYKSLNLRNTKRVFILGPSHTYYLRGCALTQYDEYATPLGYLTVDADVIAELKATGKFRDIPKHSDEEEHSLEMHLPYLWKRLRQTLGADAELPKIVPVLIGDNSGAEEKAVAQILLPYLRDPQNAFVVSSDFCHWGRNFGYRPYAAGEDLEELDEVRSGIPKGQPIHEFIALLDQAAFDAIETGHHDTFVRYLKKTENTVCGRHPIGVTMAALEMLAQEKGGGESKGQGKFAHVRYERSNLVERANDTSVSYAAFYAVV